MSSLSFFARLIAPLACVGIVLAAGLTAAKPALGPHEAAAAFLNTLDADQKKLATYPFADDERFNWHFVPRDDRKGLPLWSMSDTQQAAALALLSSCLSADGYKSVNTIRDLENVLLQMEKASPQYRNPRKYFVTLFGDPGPRGLWAWRFEGHHLSLQWTVKDGRIVASTPQFFGTNPAHVPAGLPMAGTRVLAAQEDLGRKLIVSLDPEQRAQALTDPKAPSDIATGNSRVAAIQEDRGITYATLNAAQKKNLVALIEAHAAAQTSATAKQRLAAIRKAGLDKVKFAWMGGVEAGQPHYYRIQGPTFLIEYDNTQNNANHVHDVWRDFAGDFGRAAEKSADYGEDVLAEHYAADHR